jgi:hypothetical protein
LIREGHKWHLFIANFNKRIHFAIVSMLLIFALSGCSPQGSSEASPDELEFIGVVSGSETCELDQFDKTTSIEIEFINKTKELIDWSFSKTYNLIFLNSIGNDLGQSFLRFPENAVMPGEIGLSTAVLQQSVDDTINNQIVKISIVAWEKDKRWKESEVLYSEDVDIDTNQLCQN